MRRSPLWSIICLFIFATPVVFGQATPVKAPKTDKQPGKTAATDQSAEADKFFASPHVVKLKLEIAPAELQKLRDDNRNYVRCTVIENGKVTYQSVAIKLKGAAGSFREIDDRPAFTLNASKFAKKQSFHGLEKFHLNNSVQDESYLNELLCTELFRQAGQPVPRVTHARVWLNDRDLGLYVFKEGFDRKFLQRHFADPTGNLYDGGFLQDIDADLEKDTGDGPDDFSDLRALREACAEPDPATRWKRVAALVDIDKFIDFMAMELMACHWDGYTLNKNNYRLYFDPQSKQAHFLAHGMDQMFGDPGAAILDYPAPIVSSTVMQNPEWRKKYRTRLKQLLPLFAPPTKSVQLIDAQQKRLLPVLREMGRDQANAFQEQVAGLKQRLKDRAANLKEQVLQHDPSPLEFGANGIAKLDDWYAAAETEGISHQQVPAGKPSYMIKCEQDGAGNCIASWRRKVLLANGHYVLEAKAKTKNVTAIEDERGGGVGLRLSGATPAEQLTGTNDWKLLRFEFEIQEEVREVELIAELRATGGQVWFDAKSLRLRKVE